MAAVPGAHSGGVPAQPGRKRAATAVRPRITAGANGASTGAVRPAPTGRALPSGWGVVRRRLSTTMIIAVAMLTIATAGLFQVLQSSRVAEVGYQLRALETERDSLDAQIRLLEARLAASSNLDLLRDQAQTRLGMVLPTEQLNITVDVPAPHVVPLPRRYVEIPPREAPPAPSWWEELIGSLPGFD